MANPQVGEWYLGAKCPTCDAMVAHAPDPARGKGEPGLNPGNPQITLTCPNGHKFDLVSENLVRFEWGSQ